MSSGKESGSCLMFTNGCSTGTSSSSGFELASITVSVISGLVSVKQVFGKWLPAGFRCLASREIACFTELGCLPILLPVTQENIILVLIIELKQKLIIIF